MRKVFLTALFILTAALVQAQVLSPSAKKDILDKYQKHIKFFNTHQTLAKKILLQPRHGSRI